MPRLKFWDQYFKINKRSVESNTCGLQWKSIGKVRIRKKSGDSVACPESSQLLWISLLMPCDFTQVCQFFYGPDSAPGYFWFFPKLNSQLKERFQTMDKIKENEKEYFINCFENENNKVICGWESKGTKIGFFFIHIKQLHHFHTNLMYDISNRIPLQLFLDTFFLSRIYM